MLVVVRHGKTKYNGKNERLRGQMDLPLSDEGKVQAENTAEKIKNFNIPFDEGGHYTSPLQRATHTADAIGDEIGAKFQKTDHLKDWDIGDFEGKPVDSSLKAVHNYIDNPDKPMPNGESYNSFAGRVAPFIKNLVENDGNEIAVTHNRITTLIHAMAASKGNGISKAILKKKGPIEPGGVMMVNPDWSIDILHKGETDET
jgi:broad specificity phosphatase PhoE